MRIQVIFFVLITKENFLPETEMINDILKKMPKQNYQTELDKIISSLTKKPALLLHACCGPCSSYVIEYLAKFFDITILYYNPNIYPEEEYFRRLNELKNLLPRFPEAIKNNVKLVEQNYDQNEFYEAIKIKEEPELANEAEKGERCRRCYELRIKRAFNYACEHNFDYFCTTLSISPFKDAEKINKIGEDLCKSANNSVISTASITTNNSVVEFIETTSGENNSVISTGSITESENNQVVEFIETTKLRTSTPKWLPSDFKKKGGFKRSLELSKEYGLYRQQYCGCVFSKTNTEKERKESASEPLLNNPQTDTKTFANKVI